MKSNLNRWSEHQNAEKDIEDDTCSVHDDELNLKNGYIIDFISGLPVKNTPEQDDALQVISHRLVEEYHYDKEQIQTQPQYRVRKRPSDETKSYPVDIAVFKTTEKIESNLYMIIETKSKDHNTGINELKLYMDMSPAEVGVWFNGKSHEYIRKIVKKDGTREYKSISNIPHKGQRIEDIGKFLRKHLDKPSNLKATFKDLHNHLAGNLKGITRDEKIAQEIVNILLCKIYDETNTGMDEVVTFRAGIEESPEDVEKRILGLFDKVKKEYDDVFHENDFIELDANSIVYIVGELQNKCIKDSDRDAIGDAFEVFIGPALRGPEGQFFTPRNVVRMVVDILDPGLEKMILDPACGSGGFLIIALEHVWRKLEKQAKEKRWSEVTLDKKRRDVASKYFRGIEKDSFLAKVTKAYMAIIGDGQAGIFCENSLYPPNEWHHAARDKVKLGNFDFVFTNPPFGTKIPIKGDVVLSQYNLGYKWKHDKVTKKLYKTTEIFQEQPPQILFLERCLQFLKPGGKLGIVLPEAVFGMPTYQYVITFLRQNARILGVISMPEPLFKTSGKGGTHTKTCVVFIENTIPREGEDWPIFMADAKWCGHDSRGNPTIRADIDGKGILLDDIPTISKRYKELFGGAVK